MIGSLVVFGIAYLFIATEKIDKTVAALLGAATVVVFGLIPYQDALHAIDLNVIFLLVGMMVVMSIMSETGVFEWIAIKVAQYAGGKGSTILALFLIVTAVLSAFLDNVTTVILIAPITILICEILEMPVVPCLALQAIASNIGGTSTLIGDPPNVIIASQTGLTFNDFIYNLTPIIVVAMLVVVPIILFVYRKDTKTRETVRKRIMRARPNLAIVDPEKLKKSLAVFSVILIAFFLSHTIHVEPGLIAITGALVMSLVCRADLHHALEKVEWNSVFFFMGLFMMIGALEHNGVFEEFGLQIVDWTQGNLLLTVLAVLWISAIASAIVDNIPLVIAMVPLIQTIIPQFARQMGLEMGSEEVKVLVAEPLYWSLALGACLGGNGTLVGASANVVVAQIARRNRYNFTFMSFTRIGAPIMLITLVLSTAYVYLRYFLLA